MGARGRCGKKANVAAAYYGDVVIRGPDGVGALLGNLHGPGGGLRWRGRLPE